MRKIIGLLVALVCFVNTTFAQNDEEEILINCDTNIVVGQNLIVNGGFEDGDVGFSVPGYRSWNTNPPNFNNRWWSLPGEYLVYQKGTDFNPEFSGVPKAGKNFLMIDGNCNLGSVVWEQQVNIAPNTRYFFQVNISSLKNSNESAILRFEIADVILPETIIAPKIANQWVSFVDSSWYSGNKSGLVTIRIINNQVSNCDLANDFALDEITFTAGCFFGADGLIPDLGPDLSLCGTEGEITLRPNIPEGNDYRFLWSTSDADTLSALTITRPGTYALCMTTNGSCVKSDKIRINQKFEIELGGDNAVCKEIKDTLSVAHTGPKVTYKWYRNGNLIPNAIGQVYIPTEVGNYKVEVFDGAARCGTKADSMQLSKGSLSINLGADQELCRPGKALLDAGYDGIGYEWYLNGNRLGNFNTQQIEVNQVGQYRVVVKDAICDDAEDIVRVTSKTFRAVNATFCPGDTTVLRIENTSGAPTNYKWYSDAGLTNEVASGLSFTIPDTLTQTTTYYVKDVSVFQGKVGPTTNAAGGFGEGTNANKWIEFNVLNTVVIDSVLVYPMFNQNFNVGFAVYNRNTNALVASRVVSVSLPGNPGNNHLAFPTYVPLNISLPPGQYYVKNDNTSGVLHYNQGQWTPTFPYNDGAGVLSIVGLSPGERWSNTLYGYFYDWHFSTGTVCDPVQVQAVYDPFVCAGCVSPNDAEVIITSGQNPISCSSGPVTLKASVVGGVGNWTYAWSKDGTPLSETADSLVIDFDDAGTYVVKVEDLDNPSVCYGLSRAYIVNTTIPETPIVSLDAALNTPICLQDTWNVLLTATNFQTPPTVFSWYVNDTLNTSSTGTSIDLDLKDGDEIKVMVTGFNTCGEPVTAADSLIVQEETPVVPTVVLSSVSACEGDAVVVTATVSPASTATFDWSIGSDLVQSGSSNTLERVFDDNDSISVAVTIVPDVNACVATTNASAYTIATIISSVVQEVSISANKNNVCANDLPVVFTATPVGGGAAPTYNWYVNDQYQLDSDQSSVFISSAVVNNDQVHVVMTSSISCVTEDSVASNKVVMSFIPVVPVSVSLNSTTPEACNGATIDLEALASPATGSFRWTVNGVEEGTDSPVFASNTLKNGDEVNVIFTPSTSCPSSTTVSADIPAFITILEPTVAIQSLYTGIWCEGKDNGFVVVDASLGGDNPSFVWSINGVVQSETGAQLIRSDFAEGDSVHIQMLTSSPNETCINPETYAKVAAQDTQVPVSVTLPTATICDNQSLTLSAISTNEGSEPVYVWKLNGETLENENTATIVLSTLAGNSEIEVKLTSSLSCVSNQSDSATTLVNVVSTPDAVVSPREILLNDYTEVVLDATSSSLGDVNYLWASSDTTLNDEIVGRQMSKATVTPKLVATTFYFQVSRTDGITCSDKDSVVVTVDYRFEIPNAFSPNGDDLNDFFVIDNLDKLDSFRLQIYNRWGTLLFQQTNLSNFWDGTYNGNPVPVATYYFVFEYEQNGEKQTPIKDFISLIR